MHNQEASTDNEINHRETSIRVRIKHDSNAENPREFDNIGTIYYWHSKRVLGDTYVKSPIDINLDGCVYLPVYAYDHGDITIRTVPFHCPWDTGQVGIIAAPRGSEGLSDKDIVAALRSEIDIYDQYIRGNSWGYVVEEGSKCDHGHYHFEEIDSCWGFIGDSIESTSIRERITKRISNETLESAWNEKIY